MLLEDNMILLDLWISGPYGNRSTATYKVHIQSNHPAFSLSHSEAFRSYSDFCWLRNIVQRHHPEKTVPSLPPRWLIPWITPSEGFLETRREGLVTFLRSLISEPVFLGEKALHLFLQSNLKSSDIQANLDGHRDDDIVLIEERTDFRSTLIPVSPAPSSIPDSASSVGSLEPWDDGYSTSTSQDVDIITIIKNRREYTSSVCGSIPRSNYGSYSSNKDLQ